MLETGPDFRVDWRCDRPSQSGVQSPLGKSGRSLDFVVRRNRGALPEEPRARSACSSQDSSTGRLRLRNRTVRSKEFGLAVPQPVHLTDVAFGVELTAGARTGHIADLAEDGPVKPWAVELAQHRPGDAGVAVGIAA